MTWIIINFFHVKWEILYVSDEKKANLSNNNWVEIKLSLKRSPSATSLSTIFLCIDPRRFETVSFATRDHGKLPLCCLTLASNFVLGGVSLASRFYCGTCMIASMRWIVVVIHRKHHRGLQRNCFFFSLTVFFQRWQKKAEMEIANKSSLLNQRPI